jgi:hypothetical protein
MLINIVDLWSRVVRKDADALLASGRALLLAAPVPSLFLRAVHTDDATVILKC